MSLKLFKIHCEASFDVFVLAADDKTALKLTEDDFAEEELRHQSFSPLECGRPQEVTDYASIPREWHHTLLHAENEDDEVTPEVWFKPKTLTGGEAR